MSPAAWTYVPAPGPRAAASRVTAATGVLGPPPGPRGAAGHSAVAAGCPLGAIPPRAQGGLWRKEQGEDRSRPGRLRSAWAADRGAPRPPVHVPLQLYTLSQDGALCVWQCDTPPEGLRLKPPRGWKADLQRREEEEAGEGEEDEARETTVRGQAAPAAEDQRGKVKYSRLAKYVPALSG